MDFEKLRDIFILLKHSNIFQDRKVPHYMVQAQNTQHHVVRNHSHIILYHWVKGPPAIDFQFAYAKFSTQLVLNVLVFS